MQTITFSKNVKRLRAEHGMTAAELSKILGIAPTTISTWERNKSYPDVAKLVRLADIFGVSLEMLIYGRENDIYDGLSDMQRFIVKETIAEFRKSNAK